MLLSDLCIVFGGINFKNKIKNNTKLKIINELNMDSFKNGIIYPMPKFLAHSLQVSDKLINTKRLQKFDIIISKRYNNTNPIAIFLEENINKNYLVNNQFIVVRPDLTKINPFYVFCFLKLYLHESNDTLQNLNVDKILSIEILDNFDDIDLKKIENYYLDLHKLTIEYYKHIINEDDVFFLFEKYANI